MAFAQGNPVGFFTGDNLRLLEDAQILKPVFFPSVPRVLNRVYASASTALLNGGLKGTLLQKAIDAKIKGLRETGTRDHLLWDRLVFRKVRHPSFLHCLFLGLFASRVASFWLSACRCPRLVIRHADVRDRWLTLD
jgi:hypothetical protein